MDGRDGRTALPQAEIFCNECVSEFVFTKFDVLRITDNFGITDYYVDCPVCGHRQNVSAWARDWFEPEGA